MNEIVQIKYAGTAPGADANTYNLFDSTVAFPGARMAQGAGLARLVISMKNVGGAGTVKLYASDDRGVTWRQVYDSGSVAAPAASTSNLFDLLIEPYPDFKADWINGGSAQTTWQIDIALVAMRAAAS